MDMNVFVTNIYVANKVDSHHKKTENESLCVYIQINIYFKKHIDVFF